MKKDEPSQPSIIRLIQNVKVSFSQCWEFQGPFTEHGYGLIYHNKKQHRAHRVSYEILVGPFNKELHVLHKCDNPPCVNPDHLFLGTHQENMTDMIQKKRHSSFSKTHCKQGHELFGSNLAITRRQRVCKTCRNEANRVLYWKKKGAKNEK